MKTFAKIARQYNIILRRATDGKPEPVNCKDENYRHALQDLLISGMVKPIELNPRLKLQKIA
jgi:hypothetical protein